MLVREEELRRYLRKIFEAGRVVVQDPKEIGAPLQARLSPVDENDMTGLSNYQTLKRVMELAGPDVFISFVEPYEHKEDKDLVPKMGIRPKVTYKTPHGNYGYPFDRVNLISSVREGSPTNSRFATGHKYFHLYRLDPNDKDVVVIDKDRSNNFYQYQTRYSGLGRSKFIKDVKEVIKKFLMLGSSITSEVASVDDPASIIDLLKINFERLIGIELTTTSIHGDLGYLVFDAHLLGSSFINIIEEIFSLLRNLEGSYNYNSIMNNAVDSLSKLFWEMSISNKNMFVSTQSSERKMTLFHAMWFICWILSHLLESIRRSNYTAEEGLSTNSQGSYFALFFDLIGIKGVIDKGSSTIHKSEPMQAVSLSYGGLDDDEGRVYRNREHLGTFRNIFKARSGLYNKLIEFEADMPGEPWDIEGMNKIVEDDFGKIKKNTFVSNPKFDEISQNLKNNKKEIPGLLGKVMSYSVDSINTHIKLRSNFNGSLFNEKGFMNEILDPVMNEILDPEKCFVKITLDFNGKPSGSKKAKLNNGSGDLVQEFYKAFYNNEMIRLCNHVELVGANNIEFEFHEKKHSRLSLIKCTNVKISIPSPPDNKQYLDQYFLYLDNHSSGIVVDLHGNDVVANKEKVKEGKLTYINSGAESTAYASCKDLHSKDDKGSELLSNYESGYTSIINIKTPIYFSKKPVFEGLEYFVEFLDSKAQEYIDDIKFNDLRTFFIKLIDRVEINYLNWERLDVIVFNHMLLKNTSDNYKEELFESIDDYGTKQNIEYQINKLTNEFLVSSGIIQPSPVKTGKSSFGLKYEEVIVMYAIEDVSAFADILLDVKGQVSKYYKSLQALKNI